MDMPTVRCTRALLLYLAYGHQTIYLSVCLSGYTPDDVHPMNLTAHSSCISTVENLVMSAACLIGCSSPIVCAAAVCAPCGNEMRKRQRG